MGIFRSISPKDVVQSKVAWYSTVLQWGVLRSDLSAGSWHHPAHSQTSTCPSLTPKCPSSALLWHLCVGYGHPVNLHCTNHLCMLKVKHTCHKACLWHLGSGAGQCRELCQPPYTAASPTPRWVVLADLIQNRAGGGHGGRGKQFLGGGKAILGAGRWEAGVARSRMLCHIPIPWAV